MDKITNEDQPTYSGDFGLLLIGATLTVMPVLAMTDPTAIFGERMGSFFQANVWPAVLCVMVGIVAVGYALRNLTLKHGPLERDAGSINVFAWVLLIAGIAIAAIPYVDPATIGRSDQLLDMARSHPLVTTIIGVMIALFSADRVRR